MERVTSITFRWTPVIAFLLCATFAQAQVPTWSEDIACLAFTHCTPCHHEGGAGPFDMTTYPGAHFWRNEIRSAAVSGYMPPWPPDPNYRPLAHERVLTQDEIDLVAAWVDGGAPEGPTAAAPPTPVYDNAAVIADPEITVIMETYTIPPSTNDLYRAFVLPITNPQDTYIIGVEVIPGNNEMVHHVLVFQDTTGQARDLDDADPGPGYTSFGGIGVNSAKLVGIWVPGMQPYFTPAGMGIQLHANADLVMQVHYPAHETPEIDSTRINLRLSEGGNIRDLAIAPPLDHLITITNGPLIIPPNVIKRFHAQYTVPLPITITAVGPHSHLLGKRMRSFAIPPGGDTIPLIDIPDWDFHWQGLYSFKRPIYLAPGTVLHGEAWYDNTVENPDNPNDPPDWVWLGEQTTNEMMLFYFAYTFGFPSDTNIVIDGSTHTAHYLDCAPSFEVGVTEVEGELPLGVRPSPARNHLDIGPLDGKGELFLLDMRGDVVRRMRINGTSARMDVGDLARGAYILQLRPEAGGPRSTKVMLE